MTRHAPLICPGVGSTHQPSADPSPGQPTVLSHWQYLPHDSPSKHMHGGAAALCRMQPDPSLHITHHCALRTALAYQNVSLVCNMIHEGRSERKQGGRMQLPRLGAASLGAHLQQGPYPHPDPALQPGQCNPQGAAGPGHLPGYRCFWSCLQFE